ncbi:MAG TPA: carboxylesterase/lipase family protein [Acidimicrobiia bacterium]|jgi:para-nitrobenzyl esterase
MTTHVGALDLVDTRDGPVRGRVERDPDGRGVRVFRGIPYAAPPVGPRRFAAPAPVAPWREPFDAARFGPSAPQPSGGPLAGLVPGMTVGTQDEDCLTLNVWTPATSTSGGARPVMVWFHGGAFTIGGSSLPTYDGARLACEGDVVVVSCNYRLGALGFASVDAPNCGLLDQLAALEWVRANAAAFGGDPGNVTVFGESAGAGCILHLLAAPGARGRFRRAIVQSGATNLTLQPDAAAEVANAFGRHLGVEVDAVDALRATPVADVLAAQEATAASVFATVGMMPFHPVADGDVVASAPLGAVAAGVADDVELLIGTTRDEMRLFFGVDTALDRDRLARRVDRLVGAADGPALLAAYEASAEPGRDEPGALWADVMTDAEMTRPAVAIADAHAARGATTYSYLFTWPAAPGPVELGACHAIDLPFTFGTLDREGWSDFVADADAAEALSARVRAAWCAFARDGDPGWPRYEPSRRTTMLLGRDARPADDPFGARLRTWPVS